MLSIVLSVPASLYDFDFNDFCSFAIQDLRDRGRLDKRLKYAFLLIIKLRTPDTSHVLVCFPLIPGSRPAGNIWMCSERIKKKIFTLIQLDFL